MTFQPLDIIVTREPNPISWYIRFRTSSRWSHVFMAGEEGEIAYTTAWNGFSALRMAKYLKGKTWACYRYTAPMLTPTQVEKGLSLCRDIMGEGYDYMGLLKMEIENIKGHGVYRDDTKKMKCSEAVMWTYRNIGAPLLVNYHKADGAIFPGEIPESAALKLVDTNDKALKHCLDKEVCFL